MTIIKTTLCWLLKLSDWAKYIYNSGLRQVYEHTLNKCNSSSCKRAYMQIIYPSAACASVWMGMPSRSQTVCFTETWSGYTSSCLFANGKSQWPTCTSRADGETSTWTQLHGRSAFTTGCGQITGTISFGFQHSLPANFSGSPQCPGFSLTTVIIKNRR